MEILVNNSWQEVEPKVLGGGSWKDVEEAYVMVNSQWQRVFKAAFEWTSSGPMFEADLYTALGGILPEEDVLNIYVNHPMYSEVDREAFGVGSASPALTIGQAFQGKTINLYNKSQIIGAGAPRQRKANIDGSNGWAGYSGGTALKIHPSVIVNLYNEGHIYGGAGGGGHGGAGGKQVSSAQYVGGGIGGAGAGYNRAAEPGGHPFLSSHAQGGYGGAGGSLGQPGNAGLDGEAGLATSGSRGGAGGSVGTAIDGRSAVNIMSGASNILGGQIN